MKILYVILILLYIHIVLHIGIVPIYLPVACGGIYYLKFGKKKGM